MNNVTRKLNYLVRKIKRTYKWYTGEREDGSATIADLATLFKLPVSEENTSDYEVRSFNSKIPSIEFFCKKDNSTYYAEYSEYSELMGYCGCEVIFINHSINYSDKIKRQTTYSLWCDEIYFDKISITLDERYTLWLFRRWPAPYSISAPNFPETSIVLIDKEYKAFGNVAYNIRRIQPTLYEFEMEEVYNNEEYQYKLSQGIFYSKLERSEFLHASVFCENVFEGVDRYSPCSFPIEKLIEEENNILTNDQVYSTLFFFGLSAELEIYKECTNFKIKYIKRNLDDFNTETFEYLIPVLLSCSLIDYMEYEYLESEINKIIENENVLKKIQEKLREIKFRLMVSKGLAKKEETILSIDKYSDVPFEDAVKLFIDNKDKIFEEILNKLEIEKKRDN